MSVIVERDLVVPTTSGVEMRADVYRPADAEPHAVLLHYTAYNKANWLSVFGAINPLRAVANGFVVVAVDAIGRFASGGEPWRPFLSDGEGADAAIRWIATQPWADGTVGMYGASNSGVPTWQAARLHSPGLKAIVPHFTASEFADGWVYRGGAFQYGFNAWWTLVNLAPDLMARAAAAGADVGPARAEAAVLGANPDALFARRPFDALGAVHEFVPHYEEWLRSEPGSDYWTSTSIADQIGEIELPVLHVAGWFNVHLDGNLANYEAMRTRGPGSVRDHQHLVIGPWTQWMPAVGDQCGPEARFPTALFDMEGLQLQWFDRHLRGADVAPIPRARVFVMGVDEWRDFAEWPPPEGRTTELRLTSGVSAVSRSGDGALLLDDELATDGVDMYRYDPADPVPTVGGATMLPSFTVSAGPRDQSAVEDRGDVLVYSTAPLLEPLTVVGPVTLRVFLSSTAGSTDIVAKLVDVHPDGRAVGLCDGIVRTGEHGQPVLDPDAPNEIVVDLIATANVFRRGHRVRLEIAGSNYPKFDLHTRRPGPGVVAVVDPDLSVQTVHHGPTHPSALILHVLE